MTELFGALVAFIAGLITGFFAPSIWIAPLLAMAILMYADVLFERRIGIRLATWIQLVFGALFVFFIGTLIGGFVGVVVGYPIILLYGFWLYALIATGYLISRCVLGWHVGASAAVLLTFLAVGLLISSLVSGVGGEWLVLLIIAAGMWWGADSWRRANNLALNE